jgi:septal ring factor EnvC (AmiA/AmiB activator)
MLSEPLFRCLERAVITVQKDNRVWMLHELQNELHEEFSQVQQQLDRQESERDTRVAALQKLVDGISEQQARVDQLELAIIRADNAEKAQHEAEQQFHSLLEAQKAAERKWYRRLLKWGQY